MVGVVDDNSPREIAELSTIYECGRKDLKIGWHEQAERLYERVANEKSKQRLI